MRSPKVCIVTPIHNDWEATSRYLASVGRLSYPDIETIIVDDGSTDGSSRLIRERFPETTIVVGDGTWWWARATNAGVEKARERGAAFVFTCNNDVILHEDAISSSVSDALSSGKALVGATVFYQGIEDRVWFAGADLDRSSGDIVHRTETWPASEGPRPTAVLTGMGMLIPVEAFDEVGLFDDECFPHYLADCDFSLRAAENGYDLLVSPASKIFNDISSAWSEREFAIGRVGFLIEMLFRMRSAYWLQGRVRFYRRHWGRGWIRALARLYRTWFLVYAGPILKRKLSLLLPRKRRP